MSCYGLYFFYAAFRRIRTVKKSCDTSAVRFVCGISKFTKEKAVPAGTAFFIIFLFAAIEKAPCTVPFLLLYFLANIIIRIRGKTQTCR